MTGLHTVVSLCLILLLGQAYCQQTPLKELPGYGKVTAQYTGYIVANQTLDTQLFYWLVENPTENASSLPLLVWLQGGPGCSSLLGLFQENGPFYVLENLTLIDNENSWSNIANVLYIDQPIGTGFSVADKGQYLDNEEAVAKDLYAALQNFLTIFPNYVGRPMYIAGESYAGKYIPWLGNEILTSQGSSNTPLNVVGLSIGDGFTSPIDQISKYAEQAFAFGLIDHKERLDVDARMDVCRTTYLLKEWDLTTEVCNDVLSSIGRYSGGVNVEDMTSFSNSSFNPYIAQYLDQDDVKRAIGVPVLHKYRVCSDEVSFHLLNDNYKPAVQFLPDELANFKVLIYSGNLDLICGSLGTEAYLESLDWPGKDEYNKADKTIWLSRFTSTPAGYVTQAYNLTYIIVMNAGHMVPFYQPQNALDMMNRFINNIDF